MGRVVIDVSRALHRPHPRRGARDRPARVGERAGAGLGGGRGRPRRGGRVAPDGRRSARHRGQRAPQGLHRGAQRRPTTQALAVKVADAPPSWLASTRSSPSSSRCRDPRRRRPCRRRGRQRPAGRGRRATRARCDRRGRARVTLLARSANGRFPCDHYDRHEQFAGIPRVEGQGRAPPSSRRGWVWGEPRL